MADKAEKKDAVEVTVCGGTGCLSNGSEQVAAAISEEMKKQGLNGKAALKKTGCHGFCERGPLVMIKPLDIFYQRVAVNDAADIVSETLVKGKTVERLLYTDPASQEKIARQEGFEPTQFAVKIYGRCADCTAKRQRRDSGAIG